MYIYIHIHIYIYNAYTIDYYLIQLDILFFTDTGITTVLRSGSNVSVSHDTTQTLTIDHVTIASIKRLETICDCFVLLDIWLHFLKSFGNPHMFPTPPHPPIHHPLPYRSPIYMYVCVYIYIYIYTIVFYTMLYYTILYYTIRFPIYIYIYTILYMIHQIRVLIEVKRKATQSQTLPSRYSPRSIPKGKIQVRGSCGTITSRPSSEMVVSSILITEHGDILDDSRTKWTLAVSVRNVRRIRNVESSKSLWAVFVSFAFCRVLFRPRILFKSNRLLIVLRLKPYFHSRFRKTHRLSKGIENIQKTSARRFVTRRGSSRRSRSRLLDFLDDLSSICLGDRYVFSPLLSFA